MILGAWLTDMTLTSALVVGLALLVVADEDVKGAIPTECPKSDIGNTTVNLAHESDCTKYYGCSGGKKWLKECPIMDADGNRLHFNPILQVCDWPENVNCKLPKLPITIALLAEIPKECPKFDVANETVHLEHESDCTKFYKCSNGKKFEMECPVYDDEGNRLYFNVELQQCDWPWNVDCKHPKPPSAFVRLAEIPKKCPKFDVENETVHLEHESDCTKFYKCSHGKKFEMECPVYDDEGNRLYFNVKLQQCDWPWNVHCKHPKPPSAFVRSAEIPKKCPKFDVANETVHLEHESDCTKFYKCSNGKKFEMECPVYDDEGNRLYFNVELQQCDWPWNVDCKHPKPPSAFVRLAEIPKKCPKFDVENETVHLEHESDCTKFYKCSHGKKFEMECPVYDDEGNRLYFNVELQQCDWPWNVDCKHPKPPSAFVRLPEIPKKCPKFDVANETVHLEHESDCTKFYKCSHGKKFEMECPVYDDEENRLYFNVKLQQCDWPWNVDCKHPKPRSAFVRLAEIPKECPKVDVPYQTVHLAHETDCTKFYICNHGQKVEMDCPFASTEGDKLHFDATEQICDWPENAHCQ